MENTCAAVRAMAAARAASSGAHRQQGYSAPMTGMADMTGSSRQQAKAELETGGGLGDCPETKRAAVAGELSSVQAGEIAKTEQEKPGSEGDLVRKAKSSKADVVFVVDLRTYRSGAHDGTVPHHRWHAGAARRRAGDDQGCLFESATPREPAASTTGRGHR